MGVIAADASVGCGAGEHGNGIVIADHAAGHVKFGADTMMATMPRAITHRGTTAAIASGSARFAFATDELTGLPVSTFGY